MSAPKPLATCPECHSEDVTKSLKSTKFVRFTCGACDYAWVIDRTVKDKDE